MKVIVDTCVWSYALRHKNPDPEVESSLKSIIQDGRLAIIGPIRQEILSGVSRDEQFFSLKDRLSVFEDILLNSNHFIKAAEFCNTCMKKGIQGSNTDFLICAVASIEKLCIFTKDIDFNYFSKCIPVMLFEK